MNVIVVGCGRVGSQLATLLSVEGHNVTVIDQDDEAFRRLGTTFNGVTIAASDSTRTSSRRPASASATRSPPSPISTTPTSWRPRSRARSSA